MSFIRFYDFVNVDFSANFVGVTVLNNSYYDGQSNGHGGHGTQCRTYSKRFCNGGFEHG